MSHLSVISSFFSFPRTIFRINTHLMMAQQWEWRPQPKRNHNQSD